MSHKEIVDIMACEHQYKISPKQLKDRFRKWGVKKYISDSDMMIMLALKAQHQAAGRDIRFEYKGYPIEPMRIERALKRRKGPLVLAHSVPDHIKPIIHRHEDQHACDGTTDNALETPSPTDLAIGLAPSDLDPQSMSLALAWNPVGLDNIQFNPDFRPFDAQVPSPVGNLLDDMEFTDQPAYDPFSYTSSQHTNSASRAERSISSLVTAENRESHVISRHMAQASHLNSASVSDDDQWRILLDFSSNILSSSQAASIDGQVIPSADQLSQSFDSRGSTPPSFLPGSPSNIHCEAVPVGGLCTPPPADNLQDAMWLHFRDSDPEAILRPLSFMKSHLPDICNYEISEWYTFQGPMVTYLFDFIHGTWLWLEIEDLLCSAWEYNAKAVRQRQVERRREAGSLTDVRNGQSASNSSVVPPDRQAGNYKRSLAMYRVKNSSYLISATADGVLRANLNVQTLEAPSAIPSGSSYVLKISALPKASKRTTGLSITFIKPTELPCRSRIPPHIESFNIVPLESDIIQCVSRNDIQGVQRLFDAGLASPLDVDPFGFSLISGGAGTQNCDRYGKTLDVVWAIWSTFADYHTHSLPPSFYASNATRDLDDCIRMTDAALQKGCDIEDSVCHEPRVANALFEIGDWWSLAASHRAAPAKAMEYLINIGYDMEAKNANGLTPLLYTATTQKAQAVTCLAVLIRKGANVHAIDTAGRNALHCTLAVPNIFDDWTSLRLVGFKKHTISNHYFVPAYVFHTQSMAHAEDYEASTSGHGESWIIAEDGVSLKQTGGGCDCGFQAGGDLLEGQALHNPSIGIPTIICKDFAGTEHTIRHPIQVLRLRLRYRLLTLLNAGCNPNVYDNAGATPSDYARRDGLWPQWNWAMTKAGYEYKAGSDRWVRKDEM